MALRGDSDDEPDPSATAEAAPKKRKGQVELQCRACGRSSQVLWQIWGLKLGFFPGYREDVLNLRLINKFILQNVKIFGC